MISEVYKSPKIAPLQFYHTNTQSIVHPLLQPLFSTDHIQRYRMRAVFLVLLAFAGTTFAETRTTTVNVLFLSTEISTVTIKNIDKTATTYEYPCLQTSGGNTSIFVPSGGWSIGIVDPDPRSTPAPASPLNCTPYTFTQGPSTWAMTFTVPNVTYTADCTVHPDTIFSSLVRDCVSDYTYFGVIAQESIPADDVTNGMAPVTAVGDASFICKLDFWLRCAVIA
jgi:hypothetical protein